MLNKKYLLISIILFCLLVTTFSQNKSTKHGLYVGDSLGNPISENPKKQLLFFLEVEKQSPSETFDLRRKIRHLSKEIGNKNNSIFLADSIVNVFKITNIVKKKNNYQKAGNRLVRKTIYFIDVECVSAINDTCPKYIRLLSIKTPKMNYKKIKKGKQFEMILYPFFKKDCCASKGENGNLIYKVQGHNEIFSNFLIDDIWVVNADLESYNLYDSPNLEGLYYFNP